MDFSALTKVTLGAEQNVKKTDVSVKQRVIENDCERVHYAFRVHVFQIFNFWSLKKMIIFDHVWPTTDRMQ